MMPETPEPAPGSGGSGEPVVPIRFWWLRLRARERPAASSPSRTRRWLKRVGKALAVVIAVWLLAAYVILPRVWRHFEHQPGLENAPKTSLTAQGIPGDPLNVALIGREEDVIHAVLGSGWMPADPITLRSSARIASSVLLDRPYDEAPVSNLFVFGRKQDLVFQKADGKSARRRHHVRFWKSVELGRGATPLWIGAVTFDRSVGFSHTTGQITHHIGPNIDAERDGLIGDLRNGGWLSEIFQVTGVGSTLLGRNGGGDLYYTDGELTVGVVVTGATRFTSPPELDNPVAVQIKEQFWTAIRPWYKALPEP